MTGGEVEAVAPIGTPQGTVVRVRNLFFNVPVRKEFLKSDSTERRRILALVSRYAIAYPEVAFLLTHEGREVFRSPGTGDPREVLAAVFGLEVAQEMITLPEPPSQEIRVRGFISPPSVHRGSRRELTFFVNGRLVQDSSLAAAVLQAYHGLLMVGRYPLAVIQLALPPDAVDVNIHPGKAEVRFKDSRQVFRVVQRAVRSTLIGQAPPPSLEMTTGWGGESYAGAPRSADPAWHMLRREKEGSSARQADLGSEAGAQVLPLLRAVGQVGTTYLVAEGPDGLYLIDQHAAHERVLFESMMRAFHRGEIESQQLLQAVTVQFLPEQAALMEEQLGALNQLGFDVTIFGRGTFRLRSVPALLTGVDAEGALRAAVEDLQEDERPLEGEVEARIAARVCKRAAIKSGQVLSLEEQRRLIRDLEACESPRTCPHGRPTMVHLSVDALERQFGRRG
jgi:DNA mismatch repair protein MutL